MDFNQILQAVSTVGFPIVAFGLMYYMINTSLKELKENITKNTSVIEKLLILLTGKKEDE